MYNGVMRALQQLGLADVYGAARVPLYVLNVTYPLIDDEIVAFCAGKTAVLMVEEGQPEYHRAGAQYDPAPPRHPDHGLGQGRVADGRRIYGAGAGRQGSRFHRAHAAPLLRQSAAAARSVGRSSTTRRSKALAEVVPPRPPGFCTGCPERPIFAAMKLVEKELGPHHVAADIGCHLFSILPPFNIGANDHGLRTGPRVGIGVQCGGRQARRSRSWATAASGTTGWRHRSATPCSTSRTASSSSSTIITRPRPAARTSCRRARVNGRRKTNNSIVEAVKGIGVEWVRQIDRTYDVGRDARHPARGADDAEQKGPKVIVASSECMLNKQRRVRPLIRAGGQGRQARW